MAEKKKKILFAGGGTGGSVSPLLAMIESLEEKGYRHDYIWIGTRHGIEAGMVAGEKIRYYPIYCGKLRRYFSWQNFIDIGRIIIGFFQSLYIIASERPHLIISAGGFVSVAVAWAGWISRVPLMVHQQDYLPGLANKLISPLASIITVTFEKSLKDYGKKAVWTGNTIRKNFQFHPARGYRPISPRKGVQADFQLTDKFKFSNDLPTVFILGGGTGAVSINLLVWESLDGLTKFCNIIHVTGKNKNSEQSTINNHDNYRSYEFLNADEMAAAYDISVIVVSRCGMGTLTELSYLGKAAIIIPLPDSHQEDNAEVFADAEAAIVLDQKKLDKNMFIQKISELLHNSGLRSKLEANIKNVIKPTANEEIIVLIEKLLK